MNNQVLIAAFVSALFTALGVIFTQRTSRRANDQTQEVRMSEEARQWVTNAQDDAKSAKTEAAAAKAESAAAHREASSARREAEDSTRALRDAQASFESVVRWVGRIVALASAVDLEHVSDPAVRRLVEGINGGPPDLSQSKLRPPPG